MVVFPRMATSSTTPKDRGFVFIPSTPLVGGAYKPYGRGEVLFLRKVGEFSTSGSFPLSTPKVLLSISLFYYVACRAPITGSWGLELVHRLVFSRHSFWLVGWSCTSTLFHVKLLWFPARCVTTLVYAWSEGPTTPAPYGHTPTDVDLLVIFGSCTSVEISVFSIERHISRPPILQVITMLIRQRYLLMIALNCFGIVESFLQPTYAQT